MSPKFFTSGFSVCLAVYDTRRGQAEGAEGDKILGFYPATTSPNMQSSIVGLAQALTMFAGTFSQAQPFHFMEAEGHRWLMHHCEPGIWMAMILNRSWLGPLCQPGALIQTASALHALFTLVHGSLSAMLHQDASAHTARCKLQPFLQEAASRLLRADTRELNTLACALAAPGVPPLVPLSNGTFAAMQTMVADLMVRVHYGSRLVAGVAVAWEGWGGGLLWSTLASMDSNALWQLATRALFPASRASRRTLPARRAGGAGATAWRALPLTSAQAWEVMGACDGAAGSVDLSGLLLPVAATAGSSSSQPPAASVDATGSGQLQLPRVWLSHGEDPCLLLPWYTGRLLVMVLLHSHGAVPLSMHRRSPDDVSGAAGSSGGPDSAGTANGVLTGSSGVEAPPLGAVSSLVEVLCERGVPLAARLTAELPPPGQLGHVRGCRYLYEDDVLGAARGSPLAKVGTLAATSLVLVADARAAADGFGCAAGCGSTGRGSSSASSASDVEVCARGASDAWVVARGTDAGRRVVVALEGDREELPAVTARVQDLCTNHFLGLFDGIS